MVCLLSRLRGNERETALRRLPPPAFLIKSLLQ